MKKKIMIGALAALFLGVGVFIATDLQEKKQVSDLTRANIEAMSFGGNEEWTSDLFTGQCGLVSSNSCSVKCKKCGDITHANAIGYGVITGGFCSQCDYTPFQ